MPWNHCIPSSHRQTADGNMHSPDSTVRRYSPSLSHMPLNPERVRQPYPLYPGSSLLTRNTAIPSGPQGMNRSSDNRFWLTRANSPVVLLPERISQSYRWGSSHSDPLHPAYQSLLSSALCTVSADRISLVLIVHICRSLDGFHGYTEFLFPGSEPYNSDTYASHL